MLDAKIRPPRPAGLYRARLVAGLHEPTYRLGLVVAPAGSGKTTMLAQLAASGEAAVAWFRAETSDGDPLTFLHGLEAALHSVLPGLPGEWRSPEDAAIAVGQQQGGRVAIVVDDLHTVAGTAAEGVVERLVHCAPPNLAVLLATRVPPSFDVSRLRVEGRLLEVTGEDLRFRMWEVERLFADVYREPLPPEELARLARRTEGWAAALYLFHVATKGQPPPERLRTLAQLGSRSRLVGEYLARNIVSVLPAELGSFLLETSVLGRLSGPLCDEFLSRSGSRAVLEALADRQILSHSLSEGTYRCHEVLRSQLEAVLVERIGEQAARSRYREAAELLEAAHALPEALYAWSRAEDWDAMARLLGHDGDQISADPGAWLDLLPDGIRQHPWLLLATARQHRAAGRWRVACDHYRRAEDAFLGRADAERCRRERQALSAWLDPESMTSGDWAGVLLAAVRGNALEASKAARWLPGASGMFVSGVTLLLAGRVREAAATLTAACTWPGATPALSAGARVAEAIAGLLAGVEMAEADAARAAEEAERLGLSWLSRLSQAALALTNRPDGLSEAIGARLGFERMNDPWGASLAGLLEGLGGLVRERPGAEALEEAARGFSKLGARGLEAWCWAVRALTLARAEAPPRAGETRPEVLEAARRAEGWARTLDLEGPLAMAYRALAIAQPGRAAELNEVASSLAKETGLVLASGPIVGGTVDSVAPTRASVAIRFFGGFHLTVGESALDLGALKPRARQLLRLLALKSGARVHREVLLEALWPDATPEGGTRNLQVAVSSLRHVLGRALRPPLPLYVERQGDTYRLAVAVDASVDLVEFDRASTAARLARAAGQTSAAIAALERMLELYVGDLLPEDGPAEWVVGERERRRWQAAGAARMLAECFLEQGNPASAARACEWGLLVDQYQDALWRHLISAHEQVPNPLAAGKARRRYREILQGLECVT